VGGGWRLGSSADRGWARPAPSVAVPGAWGVAWVAKLVAQARAEHHSHVSPLHLAAPPRWPADEHSRSLQGNCETSETSQARAPRSNWKPQHHSMVPPSSLRIPSLIPSSCAQSRNSRRPFFGACSSKNGSPLSGTCGAAGLQRGFRCSRAGASAWPDCGSRSTCAPASQGLQVCKRGDPLARLPAGHVSAAWAA